jgi:hypothetical protein
MAATRAAESDVQHADKDSRKHILYCELAEVRGRWNYSCYMDEQGPTSGRPVRPACCPAPTTLHSPRALLMSRPDGQACEDEVMTVNSQHAATRHTCNAVDVAYAQLHGNL